MRGLQYQLERHHRVKCRVVGHNQHGHVERGIRSVQESFNNCGLLTKRYWYTATTLQTLAKIIIMKLQARTQSNPIQDTQKEP